MKSKLERTFAERCDQLGLAWRYEPDTLLLSDGRRYIPDFWVEEWQSHVEIKGRPLGLDKVMQAQQDGHAIVLLMTEDVAVFLAATTETEITR